MMPDIVNAGLGASSDPCTREKPFVPIRLRNHLVVGSQSDLVDILVLDRPGPGGGHHEYGVSWPVEEYPLKGIRIRFQKGPIPEEGCNGLTNEALLAIVEHRLSCFQNGAYPNQYTEAALTHVTEALRELKARTIDRMTRQVEGQYKA